jgi:ribonuclease-3
MHLIDRRGLRLPRECAPRADRSRRTALRHLERRAGIRFRDHDLLNLAFCHRSYAHEARSEGPDRTVANNEKLEFLGDAVLGLVTSAELYAMAGPRPEGELARIKSFVVSEQTLYEWAVRLGLREYLLIGRGEELSGGRDKKAILADAMEAIIGAYYLDSGAAAAQAFVLRFLRIEIDRVWSNTHRQDFKTLLQELAQRRYRCYPRYRVVRQEGPDHDRTFWIEVKLNDHAYGPGSGKNKKEAEQEAASHAYAALNDSDSSTARPSGAAGGSSDRPRRVGS